MAGAIRVGVGGWVYEPWRGTFYPAGLPKTRELEEIAEIGVTPAERALELYDGPWGGDASRAFAELAY